MNVGNLVLWESRRILASYPSLGMAVIEFVLTHEDGEPFGSFILEVVEEAEKEKR